MSKPEKLVLDECVFEEPTTKKIKTTTNKKFKNNLDIVRKIISSKNQQYIDSQLKVADLIIKGQGPVSPDNVIAQLRKIACDLADDEINKNVLDIALLATMEKLPVNEIVAQTVHLQDMDNSQSIKPYNIKFNLKKFLYIFYQSYNMGICVKSNNLFGFVLTILKFLTHIQNIQTINFSKEEAIVLVTIYSYGGHATFDQIKSRIEASDLSECIYTMVQKTHVLVLNDLLEHLKTVKTIDIISGEYTIIEDLVL